jgi:hypothetical protein
MRKSGAKRKSRDINAMLRRRTGLDESQRRDLGLAYHCALAAMERGYGDEQTHSTLCVVAAIGAMLCEKNIMSEHIHYFISAQDALDSCRERGKWGFTAKEMKAMRIAISFHDEQIAIAPTGLIEDLLKEMFAMLA